MKTRHAFTLIETLVVMSVSGLLMTLAITTLERSLSIGTQTADRIDDARSAIRLVDQFRDDLRIAKTANTSAPSKLEITLARSVITYEIDKGTVNRVEVIEDDKTRNETYPLGYDRTAAFASQVPDRISLSITFLTGLKHEPTRLDNFAIATIGSRIAKEQP